MKEGEDVEKEGRRGEEKRGEEKGREGKGGKRRVYNIRLTAPARWPRPRSSPRTAPGSGCESETGNSL